MRKVDEEEEQKRNHKLALAPDATESLLTTTTLPLTSRWCKHASVSMSIGKHKVHPVRQHGTRRRIRIKRKRKGRNQGGKGKRKNNKQPVFNNVSNTTSSLKGF